ncbi:MAG: hypothetical protein KF687_03605 [Cyclobacteriaceae bacterium]|nr:hypothetical protein [Cyclobacteriaceae bacterium]
MSSHHIVRENQEPALVIADMSALPVEWLQQLLEWSPTVTVFDSAVEAVRNLGIKLDVVITKPGRVREFVDLLNDQTPVKILGHHTDDHPVNTAMMFFVAGKYKAVNVVGIEPSILEPFTAQIDIVTFHGGKRWVYARQGKFEKWVTKGTTFTLPEKLISVEGIDAAGYAVKDGIVKAKSDLAFWIGEKI